MRAHVPQRQRATDTKRPRFGPKAIAVALGKPLISANDNRLESLDSLHYICALGRQSQQLIIVHVCTLLPYPVHKSMTLADGQQRSRASA